jgi:hypothetical protein
LIIIVSIVSIIVVVVDAKFINVETGEIAFSVGVDGAREKFFDLKKTLVNMIMEKLK